MSSTEATRLAHLIAESRMHDAFVSELIDMAIYDYDDEPDPGTAEDFAIRYVRDLERDVEAWRSRFHWHDDEAGWCPCDEEPGPGPGGAGQRAEDFVNASADAERIAVLTRGVPNGCANPRGDARP